jgi:hypothetical protein
VQARRIKCEGLYLWRVITAKINVWILHSKF